MQGFCQGFSKVRIDITARSHGNKTWNGDKKATCLFVFMDTNGHVFSCQSVHVMRTGVQGKTKQTERRENSWPETNQ